MLTWLQNSKKCSERKTVIHALLIASSVALALSPSSLFASASSSLLSQTREQLLHYAEKGSPLPRWLHQTEKDASQSAEQLKVLSTLCEDLTLPAEARYACVLSATRLGGFSALEILTTALEDPSWLVRSGALKAAIAILKSPPRPTRPEERKKQETLLSRIEARLQDPALAVRREALEATTFLPQATKIKALQSALTAEQNYHKGKPLWIPQRALALLKSDPAPEVQAWVSNFTQTTPHAELRKALQTGSSR